MRFNRSLRSVQRVTPPFVNLAGHNPFLCDVLVTMLSTRTQSLMREERSLQSNRLRVFYRGVNYSGVMTPDSTLADFAYDNESYPYINELI